MKLGFSTIIGHNVLAQVLTTFIEGGTDAPLSLSLRNYSLIHHELMSTQHKTFQSANFMHNASPLNGSVDLNNCMWNSLASANAIYGCNL